MIKILFNLNLKNKNTRLFYFFSISQSGFAALFFFFALIACHGSRSDNLTIATSANMQFAIEHLQEEFIKTSGIPCEVIIGSSGKLTAQIKEGAPFDVFLSADMKYPNELFEQHLTLAAPTVYAYGKLVLWTNTNDVQPSIDILTSESVKHIAIANPKTAPYGSATLEIIDHYKLRQQLTPKLVFGESVAQTNQFILSKAATLGFTSKSTVLSIEAKGKGSWIELENRLYTPIEQGVVLLKKRTEFMEEAQAFHDFLQSDQAKKILIRFGYAVE